MEQHSNLLQKSHNKGFENLEINLIAKDGRMVNLISSARAITVNTKTYLFFAMRENH